MDQLGGEFSGWGERLDYSLWKNGQERGDAYFYLAQLPSFEESLGHYTDKFLVGFEGFWEIAEAEGIKTISFDRVSCWLSITNFRF